MTAKETTGHLVETFSHDQACPQVLQLPPDRPVARYEWLLLCLS